MSNLKKNKKQKIHQISTAGKLFYELDILEIPMFSFESNRNKKDLTQEYQLEPVIL